MKLLGPILVFATSLACQNENAGFSGGANRIPSQPQASASDDAVVYQGGEGTQESSDQEPIYLPSSEATMPAMEETADTSAPPPEMSPMDPSAETPPAPATSSSTASTTPTAPEFKIEILNDATVSSSGSTSTISESELKGCRDYFNGEGNIVTYSNGGKVNLGVNDILALKVTGNNQEIIVNLAPATEQTMALRVKGVCFFLAGNDARASLSLKSTALEKLWNRALGNGGTTLVNVPAGSSVGMFEIMTNGNGSSLQVTGAGVYTCPANHPNISCMK